MTTRTTPIGGNASNNRGGHSGRGSNHNHRNPIVDRGGGASLPNRGSGRVGKDQMVDRTSGLSGREKGSTVRDETNANRGGGRVERDQFVDPKNQLAGRGEKGQSDRTPDRDDRTDELGRPEIGNQTDRADQTDNSSADPMPPGSLDTSDSNDNSNAETGNSVIGNDGQGGVVVDDAFTDLVDEGADLNYDNPAPWDNPNDPFWDQERPVWWKGDWPGTDPDIGVKLPPPPVLIDDDHEGYPLPPTPTTPPVIICPPGDVPPVCPPVCPPACPPVITFPHCPPVCFPPIVWDWFVCRPCVTVRCPTVGWHCEDAIQLVTGMENVLEMQGVGNQVSGAQLMVNGISMPVAVESLDINEVALQVPMLDFQVPKAASLSLFDIDGNLVDELKVELLTPDMVR